LVEKQHFSCLFFFPFLFFGPFDRVAWKADAKAKAKQDGEEVEEDGEKDIMNGKESSRSSRPNAAAPARQR
jgi:hypothetical protein